MSPELHAQPYDIHATGFYFESVEEFEEKQKACRNEFGQPVEEFEIQFIDGDDFECELAKYMQPTQATLADYFQIIDDNTEEHEQLRILINLDNGYDMGNEDVDIYYCDSMKELAEQFVDEGLFGTIPENLTNYLDYDAIARDLSFDYTEGTYLDQSIIYRLS